MIFCKKDGRRSQYQRRETKHGEAPFGAAICAESSTASKNSSGSLNAVASCALNPKGVYHAGAMVWICPAPWSETKRSELENESGSKLYGQPVQKRTRIINYQKRASVARRFSEKRSLCQKPKGFSQRDVESYLYRESTSIQGASIRMPFSAQKEEEFA